MKAEIAAARDEIVGCGRSLFDRGLATGSSGNLSIRLSDGSLLVTPTDVSLGTLDPATISHLDPAGFLVAGSRPSKEAFLHRAIYTARPEAGGIVHLHATHSAAISCMAGLDPAGCIPPLTPYFVMKIGRLPLIPYHRPGDERLAPTIARIAPDHPVLLLANHGPIAAGKTLFAAMNRIEELEETAKLFLLLRGSEISPLTPQQLAELDEAFGPPA